MKCVTLAAALVSIALSGCAQDDPMAVSPAIEACKRKGMPVSLAERVETFRANGVSLEIKERVCLRRMKLEATNLGPSGVTRDEETAAREGDVFCRILDKNVGTRVRVTKQGDAEQTFVDALNVICAVFPSDAASEMAQVTRLREAFDVLVADQR